LRAAQSCNQAVTLRSAPGAAHYGGLAYLKALFDGAARAYPKAKHSVILDCGADAALAHRGIAMGFHRVAFSGAKPMRDKLAAVAAKSGACLAPARPPRGVLDLLDSPDPTGATVTFLNRKGATKSV
tara:strand:+ start:1476 stop:1856 length:381 start_codon:yes stop_codon:yes gene_type:complete